MQNLDWIDLRGRQMHHTPWGSRNPAFPLSQDSIGDIFSAFLAAGGDEDALFALLNRHLPKTASPAGRMILENRSLFFSLEFQFYLIVFTKELLQDLYFRCTGSKDMPLSADHRIIEAGPARFDPWRYEFDGYDDGYLSITNMRSMLLYAEEIYREPGVAAEALAFLNRCVPEPFRVERSFFDRQEVLISFEYLFYLASLFEYLTNDPDYVYHSHYYGYRHDNLIARSIFIQPSISPAEGFLQWQARTNNVYRMSINEGKNRLQVHIHLRKPIQTGMFGMYEKHCIAGIRQACPAVYRAFLELAVRGEVKTKNIDIPGDRYSFITDIRWKAPQRLQRTYRFSLLAGFLLSGLIAGTIFFLPPPLALPAVTALSIAFILASTFTLAKKTGKIRTMDSQFRETRELIDQQYASLKERTEALLRERNSLEEKVAARTSELKTALERLKALDKGKTNFLANISHELRTPLTLLSVPLEEIRAGTYGNTLAHDDSVFMLMERNVRRLAGQIDQLLEFTRFDLDTIPFSPEPVELVSYCSDLAAELRPLARKKGLDLFFVNKTDVAKLIIKADLSMLETAMLNLLNNGLKFTGEGSVGISISKEGEGIRLAVEDTGIGFDPALKEKLFLRFSQLNEHRSRSYEGAGLGLALVKEISRKHGWNLDAVSSPGKGSTFSLIIPAVAPEESLPSSRGAGSSKKRSELITSGLDFSAAPTPHVREDSGKEIILLIEDNSDMAHIVSKVLAASYQVVWAQNGRQAVEMVRAGLSAALVICDVMMPEMNGYQVMEKLNTLQNGTAVPFIFLTALTERKEEIKGLSSGAIDYISKPFSPRELILKVGNILSARKASYRQALEDSRSAERLKRFFEDGAGERKGNEFDRFGISAAERRVVELLRLGLQDKEIAERLSLSPRTVAAHLGRMYQKTDTGNRTELITLLYSDR